MGEIVKLHRTVIPAMDVPTIAQVRALETEILKIPQHLRGESAFRTHHLLHGGMYHRTLITPPRTLIVGAIIKRPSVLSTYGDIVIYIGNGTVNVTGYNIVPASAGRRTAVFSLDTEAVYTMAVACECKTVEDAEKWFTDEWMHLGNNRDDNHNFTVITGE